MNEIIKITTQYGTDEINTTPIYIIYGQSGIGKTTLVKNTNNKVTHCMNMTHHMIINEMRKGKMIVIDECISKEEALKVAKNIYDRLSIKPIMVKFDVYKND